jgi:protein TonB
MPRDLFGDVTRPSISLGNRRWYTVPVSLLSHSLALGLLILLPLLAPQVMPSVFADDDPDWIRVDLPDPPPPPKPKPIKIEERFDNPKAAPLAAPDRLEPEKAGSIEPGFESKGTVPGNVLDGQFDSVVGAPPPAPPEPPKPVLVTGVIRRPQRIHHVEPVYLPAARAAGIQGIVIIEATIGPDGSVMNARVLRGLPLLDQSALDAVRQWRFTPTLHNGVPVPVMMSVTVQFTLR